MGLLNLAAQHCPKGAPFSPSFYFPNFSVDSSYFTLCSQDNDPASHPDMATWVEEK